MGILRLGSLGDLLDLALAEQRRGPDRSNAKRLCGNYVDADRLGEAFRLFDSRVRGPPRPFFGKLRNYDDRAFAPRDLRFAMAVIFVQDSSSEGLSLGSASNLSGCAGWSVESACL